MIVKILSSLTEPSVSIPASAGALLVLLPISFVLANVAFLFGYPGVIRSPVPGKSVKEYGSR
jgi:hypothetical protein